MEDDIFSLLDPTGALRQRATGQARSQGLTSLGLGLLRASRGQPGQGRPSIAQAIGEVGPVALQNYQQSFDKTITDALKRIQIQQALKSANAPRLEKVKDASGAERFVLIPASVLQPPSATRGGVTPSGVTVPTTGGVRMLDVPGFTTIKPPEFDANTQAFIGLKFGDKSYTELNPEQKLEVIKFNNAPNDEKITSLKIEAERFKEESGVDVKLPRGRGEFLSSTPPVNVAPPSVSPTTTTPIPPSAKPTSAEISDASKLRVPMTLVSRTMTDKDVPLISDPRIAPKQQKTLIEARPQTQSSVEYVVNTNRAMQNLISEILASPGLKDAFGLGGETLSKIPGSPAADARAKLERLGGNLFIEAITALRNASKTGAGVGNATEKEGDKLERSRANLQQFQSADAARTELERLLKSLKETETNVLNAYERTYGKGSFSFSPLETPDAKGKRPPLQNFFPGVR